MTAKENGTKDALWREARQAYVDFTGHLQSQSETAGIWRSVFIGAGGEIAKIRPYQPGDKLRKVHRPSLERGEILVPEYLGERGIAVWLFFDLTPSVAGRNSFESLSAHAIRRAVMVFTALMCAGADYRGISIGSAYLQSSGLKSVQPTDGKKCLQELWQASEIISVSDVLRIVPRLKLFEPSIRGAQRALVFFASDFAQHLPAYGQLFAEYKQLYKINLVPVFMDTTWIFRALVKGRWEFTGFDVAANKEGSFRLTKESLAGIERDSQERVGELHRLFQRLNTPWVHLQRPESQEYVREITRCFTEKQRVTTRV